MPRAMQAMSRTNPEELLIGALTRVELLWVEKRIETWIRFGHAAKEQIIDGSRRTVSFAPASIFAVVHWAANDYGTILSQIDILRAVAPGEVLHGGPGRNARRRHSSADIWLAEGRESFARDRRGRSARD